MFSFARATPGAHVCAIADGIRNHNLSCLDVCVGVGVDYLYTAPFPTHWSNVLVLTVHLMVYPAGAPRGTLDSR
jgi:hypothetical protein